MHDRRTALKRIAAAAVATVAAFYVPGRPWEAAPVVNPRWPECCWKPTITDYTALVLKPGVEPDYWMAQY